jgi:hypothetical protein
MFYVFRIRERTARCTSVGVLGTLSHESLAQFKASLELASADRRAAIVMPDHLDPHHDLKDSFQTAEDREYGGLPQG